MRSKSKSPGRKMSYAFPESETKDLGIDLAGRRPASDAIGVSISLKHYRQSTENLSDWDHKDLKKLDSTISELRAMSVDTLLTHAICCRHDGTINSGRFTRPEGISREASMYEIRVDPHNRARMHGTIYDSVFYLVWLDRNHEVFPWDKNRKR